MSHFTAFFGISPERGRGSMPGSGPMPSPGAAVRVSPEQCLNYAGSSD